MKKSHSKKIVSWVALDLPKVRKMFMPFHQLVHGQVNECMAAVFGTDSHCSWSRIGVPSELVHIWILQWLSCTCFVMMKIDQVFSQFPRWQRKHKKTMFPSKTKKESKFKCPKAPRLGMRAEGGLHIALRTHLSSACRYPGCKSIFAIRLDFEPFHRCTSTKGFARL